ncbi:hypothetical protein Tco_1570165 [Tanacetum coccineum]
MESIENCIVERTLHAHEIQKRLRWLNDRKLQIQVCKVQEVKALDASSGDIDISKIVSDKGNAKCSQNDCSKTGNDQSSDKQRAMNVVPYIAEYNMFAVESQLTEQLEFLNDTSLMEKVDQNADNCEDELLTSPLEQDFIRKSAEVANREIMIGVETRIKEYKTCWVDKLSIVNHKVNAHSLIIGLRMNSGPDGLVSTNPIPGSNWVVTRGYPPPPPPTTTTAAATTPPTTTAATYHNHHRHPPQPPPLPPRRPPPPPPPTTTITATHHHPPQPSPPPTTTTTATTPPYHHPLQPPPPSDTTTHLYRRQPPPTDTTTHLHHHPPPPLPPTTTTTITITATHHNHCRHYTTTRRHHYHHQSHHAATHRHHHCHRHHQRDDGGGWWVVVVAVVVVVA